ncbi:hypothetical protein [Acidithiobacillus sp.]
MAGLEKGLCAKTGWKPAAFEAKPPAAAKVVKVGIGKPEGDRFQKASWLEWNVCPVYGTMAYHRFDPLPSFALQLRTAAGQHNQTSRNWWLVQSEARLGAGHARRLQLKLNR